MTESQPLRGVTTEEDLAAAAERVATRYSPVPLADFVQQPIQRREYAVEGIWTDRASGFIAGAPKARKSTLALELAISLATGTPFLGHFAANVPPQGVTYIQAENSTERVRKDVDEILTARGLGVMVDDGSGDGTRVLIPDWHPALGRGGEAPDLMVLSNPGLDVMVREDGAWLKAHAAERDYIFLDPDYLLASADPNSTAEMMAFTKILSDIRDSTRVGLILTHQLTIKSDSGSAAARMIGSTFLPGWYESALFVRTSKSGFSTIEADNRREMGESREVGLQGLGVGSWYLSESAQGAEDALGRAAPQTVARRTNVERYRDLREVHGDAWTQERYAEELDVKPRTIRNYDQELAGESE